jgi:hypothetical protein
MLKLQIPKDQVLQRMKKEGIEEKDHRCCRWRQTAAIWGCRNQGRLEGNKLVSLHWTPLSGKALDKSVWNASKKQNVASAARR